MTDKPEPDAVRRSPDRADLSPDEASPSLSAGISPNADSEDRRLFPPAGNDPSTSKGRRVFDVPLGGSDGSGLNTKPRGSSAAIRLSPPVAELTTEKTVISNRAPYGGPTIRDGGPAEDPRVALTGRQLLHFQLEEFIGGGGMGLVFRGTDMELGRPVAVKVLIPSGGADEETVRRFRQEAQSAARLNHRNIAQVYYVGEDEGWNFIAFEFVEGENVREAVLRQGHLPIRLAVEYVMQIAIALEHAYHRGVIHRDIKPSNIVITPEGQAKLVDMGLARLSRIDSGYDDLTASGVTLGTFDYISPEQGRDPRSADIRSDLYSLGCTLYFMLTGRPPFPDGTVLQKLLRHTNDRVVDPRTFRPDIPPELGQVLLKMLAKSPNRRYQHPRDLYGDLTHVAEHHGLSVATNPDSGVTRALRGTRKPTTARSSTIIIPMVILVIVALLVDRVPSSQRQLTESIPDFVVPLQSPRPSEKKLPPEETPSDVATSADQAVAASPTADLTIEEPPIPSTVNNGDRETSATPLLRHVIVGTPPRSDEPSPPVPPDVAYVDSLAQALGLAEQHEDLQTIELEFNGPRLTRPMIVSNADIVIRAAKGFTPILQFRPTEADAEIAATRMITVVGGSVRFDGVHFDLLVPVIPATKWALFGVDNAQLLKLQSSWVTVASEARLSEYYSDVAVIDLLPTGNTSMMQSMPVATSLQDVVLQDCVVRGVGRLVHCGNAQPLRLSWSNGFLATNEQLITIGGSSVPALHGENVQVSLDHVTAVVDAGLCRMTNDVVNPHWLPLALNCTHSIIHTLPDAPMIEQVAASMPLDQFDAYFEYSGQRNFYERVTIFWSKMVREAELPESREEALTFDKWQQRWGKADKFGQWDRVLWQRRFPDAFPRAQVLPEHFAISTQPGNPARGVTSDGRDAGCDLSTLPPYPYPAADLD